MDQDIEADLTAEPLPRWKLDLLWVGPNVLEQYRFLASLPNRPNLVTAATADDENGRRALELSRMIANGTITTADLDWAIEVDRIAGVAENLARAEDHLGAIAKFREGLRQAPGADVYLMSMASCFWTLGAIDVAVRYLERAHEINPDNARIKSNLVDARHALGAGAPSGWHRYEDPDGRFSLNLPDHWQEVSPISDGASLSCRIGDDGLFEVLNFATERPMETSQLVELIADGLEKYMKHGPFGVGKQDGRVVGRRIFAFGGNDHCVELVLQYREGAEVTVSYVVCGREQSAMYLALKARNTKFDAARTEFEAVLGSLESPLVRGIEPAVLTISRGAIGPGRPTVRPEIVSQMGENPFSRKRRARGGFWSRLFGGS